ncbi:spore coat protein GerQ [Thermicanus aegyptius]|uniref:spore coat protein GerQ n=1 Tax=Thermicanus aegyptius TaxID=94009 RepID=UPI00041E2D66|nr:spore coat protein GerQ [Thermicanus aegyptius]
MSYPYMEWEYPLSSHYPIFSPHAAPTPTTPLQPSGATIPGIPLTPQEMLEEEISYVENILRFNRGKMATFFMTYENNPEWTAKVFRGEIETAGRDHIIISDPNTGKRFLLLTVNLDYVEFDERIAYVPPRIPPYVQMQLEER